eukprot:TRINITY_DN454_c0_g1::TRINITY_DN454_c0_g1_i1::g.2582::m.2582 TRINITY_DN454_c0_g1::TRINITY_DN454_c0_g1_i1::g.2582  ORF type:complete len:564 (+),score=172.17,sp/Q12669/KPYK_ASPNG/55.29/0.0,PK/PF00224.16/3.5e-164,PK_C/PF02887.11/2.8e+03,PK_C/PF02887.11/1.2e-24,HpcH_HpaI/PF03328.9/0.00012,IMPDH/PF00478.20/0.012,IMPDH/PF00478.20/77 TRINITY_DN454_c0_g1_i1:69-1760(+)
MKEKAGDLPPTGMTPTRRGSISASTRRSFVSHQPQKYTALTDMSPSRLVHHANLRIDKQPSHCRKTSIICTIGPKSSSVEFLKKMIEAGMDIVRMNFSHGSYEYHQSVVDNARKAIAETEGAVVALALDTKGPEIRTGLTESGADITLVQGEKVIVTTDPEYFKKCSKERIYVDYKKLPQTIEVDGLIYIDDGLISLRVLSKSDVDVTCEVVNTGDLGGQKGVNLPNVKVDLPALSEKDKQDLAFGVRNGVDMIFASFIRKRQDILDIRAVLGDAGKNIKIIAKIENHEGVQNFDDILEETDGVMVARGDLGIEIPPQKVFKAQKMMISRCNIAGKPVICATQMLESMITNPRPTRAEVSDVANAVIDGADCVMLSGETAKGKYPLECIRIMSSICLEAEAALPYVPMNRALVDATPKPLSVGESVASAAVRGSFEQGASVIIVLTLGGASGRALSKYRPACPIVAVTRNEQSSRQLLLSRGVLPVLYKPESEAEANADQFVFSADNIQERLELAEDFILRNGLSQPGDFAVVVHGVGVEGGSGKTSVMRVIRLGLNKPRSDS